MNPQEKAKELYNKYVTGKDEHGWQLCEFDSCAKQCALIAIQEILKITLTYAGKDYDFWQEVKLEIEKL